MAKLTFFGAAREITGSCYLLEIENTKILIDCGMFQGTRFAETKNYEPFPFHPKEIDFVLVTHAHIDHTGRLPKLFKDGFRGKIFSTKPTKDFAGVLLKDSAGLIGKEASQDKYEPLFKENDVNDILSLWQGLEYGEEMLLTNNVKCIFRESGHIMGSAFIEITFGDGISESKKIVFSGDLGNSPAPLLRSLEFVQDANYLVVESAYGDRLHESLEKSRGLFEDIIEETFNKKGVLLIPAFAVERTQELLYELNELVEHGRIPPASIFIDSPLAFQVTEIYKKYERYYNQKTLYLLKSGDEIFKFPGLKFTLTKEDSKKINDVLPPKMIIAGSGMMQGGRILHHLRRYLSDSKNALVIVSYQAANSLGGRLLGGVKEVKIFDEKIPVLAKVVQISGYSAHPDQEALLNWIKKTKETLRKVFVVQGEEKSALTLVQKIKDILGIEALAPLYKEEFEI